MPEIEKSTYNFHLRAVMFEGVFGGLLWSAPEIARKALGVDNLLLTLHRHGAGGGPGCCSLFWRLDCQNRSPAAAEKSSDGGKIAVIADFVAVGTCDRQLGSNRSGENVGTLAVSGVGDDPGAGVSADYFGDQWGNPQQLSG